MNESKSGKENARIAVMATNIEYIKRDVTEIKRTIKEDYVKRVEFEPVKRLVYGVVGLILVAVVTAIVSLVLKS